MKASFAQSNITDVVVADSSGMRPGRAGMVHSQSMYRRYRLVRAFNQMLRCVSVAAFVEDKSLNRLLHNLGVASLFLTAGILLQSITFYQNAVYQMLIGACIGFALGYAVRSIMVCNETRR